MIIQVQEWIENTSLDPLDFGWESCTESGELIPRQGISDICPKSIQEILSCKCTKGCNSNKCSCRKHGLICSTVCDCQDCENVRPDNEDTEFVNDDEEDDCEDNLDDEDD